MASLCASRCSETTHKKPLIAAATNQALLIQTRQPRPSSPRREVQGLGHALRSDGKHLTLPPRLQGPAAKPTRTRRIPHGRSIRSQGSRTSTTMYWRLQSRSEQGKSILLPLSHRTPSLRTEPAEDWRRRNALTNTHTRKPAARNVKLQQRILCLWRSTTTGRI